SQRSPPYKKAAGAPRGRRARAAPLTAAPARASISRRPPGAPHRAGARAGPQKGAGCPSSTAARLSFHPRAPGSRGRQLAWAPPPATACLSFPLCSARRCGQEQFTVAFCRQHFLRQLHHHDWSGLQDSYGGDQWRESEAADLGHGRPGALPHHHIHGAPGCSACCLWKLRVGCLPGSLAVAPMRQEGARCPVVVAGEERRPGEVSGLHGRYYRGTHGVIVVYDVTSAESFVNVKRWLHEINQNCDDVCRILVGNKNDDPERKVVETEDAYKFAGQMGIQLFETSAKENVNVEEMFNCITELVLRAKKDNLAKQQQQQQNDVVKLTKNSKRKKRCC
uniref:RAB35, member RAS oncogene family n=1 Tax=Oryctolagus cuniculus TaxID=9986 RepID=G1T7Q3_RABIT